MDKRKLHQLNYFEQGQVIASLHWCHKEILIAQLQRIWVWVYIITAISNLVNKYQNARREQETKSVIHLNWQGILNGTWNV